MELLVIFGFIISHYGTQEPSVNNQFFEITKDIRNTATTINKFSSSPSLQKIPAKTAIIKQPTTTTSKSVNIKRSSNPSTKPYIILSSNTSNTTNVSTTTNSTTTGHGSISGIAQTFALSYDNNGNIIQGIDKYYEYNGFNQLVRVRQNRPTGRVIEEYLYDHEGNRLKKIYYDNTGNQKITYYVSKDFVREVDFSGTKDTVYYYAGSDLISREDPNGTNFYYHPDLLGSTDIITAQNGNLAEETEYYPFGLVLSGGNDRFLFTGKEKDETELMYFGARYYDPFLRHWIQPDSVISDIYNPQQLNRFSYVNNNPQRYTDPSGNIPIDTIADVAFVISDIKSLYHDSGSLSNWVALGGDLLGTAIPYATGLGMGTKLLLKADNAVDAAKGVGKVSKDSNTIKAAVNSMDESLSVSNRLKTSSNTRILNEVTNDIKINKGQATITYDNLFPLGVKGDYHETVLLNYDRYNYPYKINIHGTIQRPNNLDPVRTYSSNIPNDYKYEEYLKELEELNKKDRGIKRRLLNG